MCLVTPASSNICFLSAVTKIERILLKSSWPLFSYYCTEDYNQAVLVTQRIVDIITQFSATRFLYI